MSDHVEPASTPHLQSAPPPAEPVAPAPVVKGFSPYSVVVIVLALAAAGWLARAALTLEPAPSPNAADIVPAH